MEAKAGMDKDDGEEASLLIEQAIIHISEKLQRTVVTQVNTRSPTKRGRPMKALPQRLDTVCTCTLYNIQYVPMKYEGTYEPMIVMSHFPQDRNSTVSEK